MNAALVNLDSVREERREPAHSLTRREREVLTQLALGLTTEETGEAIFLSPHTVRCHLKTAMRKLDARTRPHAVAIALSRGTIAPVGMEQAEVAL